MSVNLFILLALLFMYNNRHFCRLYLIYFPIHSVHDFNYGKEAADNLIHVFHNTTDAISQIFVIELGKIISTNNTIHTCIQNYHDGSFNSISFSILFFLQLSV